ncbi:MAG: methyltransferase type 11, partial [Synechococcaceae cyanobacterium ELA182]
LRLARAAGFLDPRLVQDRPIRITEPQIAPLVGQARFFSATYRLFNIDELEDACEDHGQAVIYRGTIPEHADRWDLDQHHSLESGRVFPVCGNTYRMLQQSRFCDHFSFIGDFSRHFGIFAGCGSSLPFNANGGDNGSGQDGSDADPVGCC